MYLIISELVKDQNIHFSSASAAYSALGCICSTAPSSLAPVSPSFICSVGAVDLASSCYGSPEALASSFY